MKKNLVLGVLISAICFYFIFWRIDVSALEDSFKSINPAFTIPAILSTLFSHYLRCLRWGIILEPLVKYNQKNIYMLGSVGFMAIGLMPARLGEFVRPWLVKRQKNIGMVSVLATIVVERLFDLLTLMLLLFIVILNIPLPDNIVRSGATLLSISICLFLVLIVFAINRNISLDKIDMLISLLPEKLQQWLTQILRSFFDGLKMLADIKRNSHVGVLSVGVWLFQSLSAYMMFFAFDLNLSFMHGMAITIIIVLGIMLPAAPGFIGTYHVACMIGLTGFGVPQEMALSYAIMLHFFQLAPVILSGIVSMPFLQLSLSKIIDETNSLNRHTQ